MDKRKSKSGSWKRLKIRFWGTMCLLYLDIRTEWIRLRRGRNEWDG